MKAIWKTIIEQRRSWLCALTLMALLTSAASVTWPCGIGSEYVDWNMHPKIRLTGMRYYLRKHGRVSLLPMWLEQGSSGSICDPELSFAGSNGTGPCLPGPTAQMFWVPRNRLLESLLSG